MAKTKRLNKFQRDCHKILGKIFRNDVLCDVIIEHMTIKNYKNLVWDYNLKQKDFEEILEGKVVKGSFDQLWAIKRVLENLNFYEAMAIIPKKLFISNWNKIKPKIFNRSIIKGYDFLLHRYTVSTTG